MLFKISACHQTIFFCSEDNWCFSHGSELRHGNCLPFQTSLCITYLFCKLSCYFSSQIYLACMYCTDKLQTKCFRKVPNTRLSNQPRPKRKPNFSVSKIGYYVIQFSYSFWLYHRRVQVDECKNFSQICCIWICTRYYFHNYAAFFVGFKQRIAYFIILVIWSLFSRPILTDLHHFEIICLD